MENQTYKIFVHCSNCSNEEYIELPKGIEFNNANKICSKCGCKTLTKYNIQEKPRLLNNIWVCKD